MGEQLIVKNLPFIKILPSWAQELSYKYCSKTANLYIIHGNIRDFLPHKMNEGEFTFVKIQDYVSEVLFGNRDIIVFWDRSSGVSFCSPDMQRDYIRAMKERFPDTEDDELLSSDPAVAFRTLERYFLLNIPQKKRIVMIIDYAETVLPAGEVAATDRVASEMMRRILGGAGAGAVSIAAMISIFAALNGSILSGARVPYAAARDGYFFSPLARVNPAHGTPGVSILALCGWAALVVLSGRYDQLFTFVIFAGWIMYGMTAASVIVLRRKRPDLPRPYRTLGYPVVPVLFVIVAICLVISTLIQSPRESLMGLALIIAGLPFYFYWRRRKTA